MYPHPSSPTVDPSYPFGSSSFPRRYNYSDNDSDNADPYGRRDNFISDSSHHGLNDDRFYDNNGPYDLYDYGRLRPSFVFCFFTPFSLSRTKDTDSDIDYGPRYGPSVESLGPSQLGLPEAGTPYT